VATVCGFVGDNIVIIKQVTGISKVPAILVLT
jgi:hypothetical protein